MMLRRVFLTFFALVLAAPALAGNKPEALIDGMAKEAISVLSASGRTDAQIKAKFHELLAEGFNLPTIGRFVLGRYWKEADAAQQAEYLKLFEDYVVGIYANRFKAYSGETLAVTGVKDVGDYTLVSSKIERPAGGQPVVVDWKLAKVGNGKWQVEDVIIEQVSMSISQRSEFATIIQNGGGKIEALLAQLRAKTKGAAAARAGKAG